MSPILRSIGSVLLGLVVGFIVVLAVEFADYKLFPPPPGLNLLESSAQAMKDYETHAPLGAMVMVILGWGISTLLASWLTARFAPAPKMLHGMIVGIFLLGAGIANMLEFPHPLWFWICGVLVFLPAAYIGSRLAAGSGVNP